MRGGVVSIAETFPDTLPREAFNDRRAVEGTRFEDDMDSIWVKSPLLDNRFLCSDRNACAVGIAQDQTGSDGDTIHHVEAPWLAILGAVNPTD